MLGLGLLDVAIEERFENVLTDLDLEAASHLQVLLVLLRLQLVDLRDCILDDPARRFRLPCSCHLGLLCAVHTSGQYKNTISLAG